MVIKQGHGLDSVQITAKGIKNSLSRYKEMHAVAELIWNGFDANATCVQLKYEVDNCDLVKSFSVSDNGEGIPFNTLKDKFKPFHESEKYSEVEDAWSSSARHGKNGVGRLTFFRLADKATWHTTYRDGNIFLEYEIIVDEKTIDQYDSSKPIPSIKDKSGTIVTLSENFDLTGLKFDKEIIPYLRSEFCWFLELNKPRGYKLLINNKELDYSNIIGEQDTTILKHDQTQTNFEIRFIRWTSNINKEFSKYYYIGQDDNIERRKEYTRLNKKGDHFHHSVFIKSSYFDNFNWDSNDSIKMQGISGIGLRSDAQFQFLQTELYHFLRRKRQPFIKAYANELIENFEREGIISKSNNTWDNIRVDDLKQTVRGLYTIQPKIFTNLNLEQKKTFVGLIDLLLNSDERENMIGIIRNVIDLSSDEREQLSDLLKNTTLSRITQTIKLIEDRYRAVSNLKQLVFNEELAANEVDHVQKFIENHYWLFGEEYALVTAAEPDFEQALRRYLYILHGENADVSVDHPNKNKEMDIFLCRQKYSNIVDNIIIELKHPEKQLGKDELDQVEEYMRTILNIPEFNNTTANWTFILVGNKLHKKRNESKPYIKSKIDQFNKEPFLAAFEEEMHYKVFVKTWAQIFQEFEQKHNFLNEKLQFQRDRLIKDHKTADAALDDSKSNTASQNKLIGKAG